MCYLQVLICYSGQDDKPKELLVIPMKAPNKKLINLVDIVQNNFVDKEEEPVIKEEQNDSAVNGNKDLEAKPLSLDELAAKELLNGNRNICYLKYMFVGFYEKKKKIPEF